jgi:hypothetical protein
MKAAKFKIVVVAVAVSFLAGCAKSNPLIGKWRVSTGTGGEPGKYADSACAVDGFEFTPTSMTSVQGGALSPEVTAGARLTQTVDSYSHDGDNYSVNVHGFPKPLKLHIESSGFGYAATGNPLADSSRCTHFVPNN